MYRLIVIEIMIYVGNAFSLQMLDVTKETKVKVTPVDDYPTAAKSIIGHADLANMLYLPCNRESVKLTEGDVLYVAQVIGGRLPEGATTLPEGVSIVFLKVEICRE